MGFEWAAFATMTALLVAVVGLLATALFQQGGKLDRLGDRMDQRFERVDHRFERVDQRFEQLSRRFDVVDQRMREDKVELLGRMDLLAERITRLETA